MESKSVRQSNIELLRIIAIFMVMIAHCNGHMAEGSIPAMTANADAVVVCRNIIGSLASICVVLFVLISGWFSIKPNLKRIATLWTQIFFVYLYVFILQTIIQNHGEVNWKTLVTCFLPFTFSIWFVRAYLLLMLFAPALNLFAKDISKRGFQLFLAIFTIMALLYGCIIPSDSAGFNKGLSPLSLIYIYMVGRYLRLYVHSTRSKWFWLCGYVVFSMVIFIGRVIHLPWILYYINPILVLSAISLFMFFVKLDIGYNRFINWVASSVFTAFILHTRPPVSKWLIDFNVHQLQTLSYINYLGVIFVVLVGFFIIAVLMDKVREFIFRPIIKWIDRVVISTDENEKFISIKKQ